MSNFDGILNEIKERLNDSKSYTSDLKLQELVKTAIELLAAETSIYADAGIDALTALLKSQGVTKKALHYEIKIARQLNPGLRCDSVTGIRQNGAGQGLAGVTSGVTPDQAVCDIDALEEQAAAVLAATDPLLLVEKQIRDLGYGGDTKAPLITYLAVNSRLLEMRAGSMPVHLLLHGPASAGKSYTLKTVLGLFPPAAYHVIDAGSPHVLIYDTEPLKHRALIFGEADSLPSGEDNPAASAVRNLTQDNRLHYEVVMKDDTGAFVVREIAKEGPTVLITTSIRKLGHQLMTRLFTLDVADDAKQVQAALATQARLEITGAHEADPALIAFQSLLQAKAPWDVVIPFVSPLAKEISRGADAPRILRDFQRVLSLIKSVTVLRHQHRQRDEKGRLMAELDDYKTVFELVAEMYAATTTGASKAVREAVEAIQDLRAELPDRKVTYSVLAKELSVHRQIAKRRADQALGLYWLVNNETRKRHNADLVIGEPMPPATGLPEPVTLAITCHMGCDSECDKLAEAESLTATGLDDTDEAVCHTVTHETDDYSGARAIALSPDQDALLNDLREVRI